MSAVERDFELERVEGPSSSLLDAVDRVLDKGASITGDLMISIANVDLIRLDLKLLLASVETLERSAVRRGIPRPRNLDAERAATAIDSGDPSDDVEALPLPNPPPPGEGTSSPAPAVARAPRLELDPKAAEKGVARLVLTLVEFIRRLLERQAIRRMEGGLVGDEAIERMGEALARLEAKVVEMKRSFGLEGEDLDLDLGPLGRLNGPQGGAT